jgi:hypothetical protein
MTEVLLLDDQGVEIARLVLPETNPDGEPVLQGETLTYRGPVQAGALPQLNLLGGEFPFLEPATGAATSPLDVLCRVEVLEPADGTDVTRVRIVSGRVRLADLDSTDAHPLAGPAAWESLANQLWPRTGEAIRGLRLAEGGLLLEVTVDQQADRYRLVRLIPAERTVDGDNSRFVWEMVEDLPPFPDDGALQPRTAADEHAAARALLDARLEDFKGHVAVRDDSLPTPRVLFEAKTVGGSATLRRGLRPGWLLRLGDVSWRPGWTWDDGSQVAVLDQPSFEELPAGEG